MTSEEYGQNIKTLEAEVSKLEDEITALEDEAEKREETVADFAKACDGLTAERDNLKLQNERLQKKVDQMRRFTECFVAHPYEGTLECDPSKPCPFCRYTSMERLLSRYQKALEDIANDKEGPFYPDGDYMSESTCAKIALGRGCPLCGDVLPCERHKEQPTERPVCDCLGHDHDGPEVCACCCMKVNDRGPDLCSKCGANRAHWTTR